MPTSYRLGVCVGLPFILILRFNRVCKEHFKDDDTEVSHILTREDYINLSFVYLFS